VTRKVTSAPSGNLPENDVVNAVCSTRSIARPASAAMNARGVGPRTAARLLDLNLTEDDFYKEILNAEREFVRTSKFWRK
jgi:ATP-dependent Lhr-like helicase